MENTSTPARYLTTRQPAAVASVAAKTIRQWVRAGRIPGHWAGRLLRVRLVPARVRELGTSRFSVTRGLNELERAGLVAVERRAGAAPLVTILEQAPSPAPSARAVDRGAVCVRAAGD